MSLSNEFILTELIKSGSASIKQDITPTGVIRINTELNTDGVTFGYVEKPIYNEQELIKAVDVVVDELIVPKKITKTPTVLKDVYDDLRELYNQAISDIKDLQKENDELKTEVEFLKNEIETLEQDLDLQKLLKSAADNEKAALAQNLESVSLDLQSALTKGVKEAVERVSREASLQGLLAEKDTFVKIQEESKNQVDRLNRQLTDLQNSLTDALNNFALATSNLRTQSRR